MDWIQWSENFLILVPKNSSWKVSGEIQEGLRRFCAADAEFPYQINVILWALDRARTLDFSLTKAHRTLPSWISH